MMRTIFLLLMTFAFQLSFAQGHDHHDLHAKKNGKQKVVNKQFSAPKDLSERMDKVHSLIKELAKNKTDKKIVSDYGNKITETVNDIFKTCKLEPEADEAIHPSLGLILDGAEQLNKGDYELGHRKIHEAILNYNKLFSKK